MTQALIDNLPLIAAAPDGIKALRGLILDLAVRGKLVPQDPKDEPASELLKRIEDERRRLSEAGSIRKGPSRPSRPAAEIEVPQGWSSASLGDIIGSIDAGWSPACLAEPSPSDATWGVLKTTAVQSLNYLQAENKQLPPSLHPRPEHEVRSGDILITRAGPKNRVGVSCLVQHTRPKLMISDKIIRIHVVGDIIDAGFVCLAMNAGVTAEFLEAAKSGMAESQMNISQEKLRVAPLAIPPLAEQRRIVAKVDELMALCDRLEAQQADAEAVHAALVKTLLDTLTQSQDADDFAANWQRLSQHFPAIFTTEASVDALKQAVVELAVTGKLVSQSSEDEAASAFLERIKSARARLTPGKMTKADKALPALTADALPFCPPFGWEWVRFDEVVLISGGLTLGRTFAGRELVSRPYLRVANVQRGHLALSEVKEVLVPPEEVEKYRLRPHDLLITEGGDWDKVGRTAIWRGEIEDCLHQNHVFKARPFISDFYDRWAELYLNSAVARSYFAGASKQTTNLASINMTQLKACLLPLPPLAEQHRIVAKVDELFALCDSLKEQIAESRAVQRQLATALVEQAVAA